jgi:hypothetical protein
MHIQLLAAQVQDHSTLGWAVIGGAALILLAFVATWLHAKFQKIHHIGPYASEVRPTGLKRAWNGPWGKSRGSKDSAGEE